MNVLTVTREAAEFKTKASETFIRFRHNKMNGEVTKMEASMLVCGEWRDGRKMILLDLNVDETTYPTETELCCAPVLCVPLFISVCRRATPEAISVDQETAGLGTNKPTVHSTPVDCSSTGSTRPIHSPPSRLNFQFHEDRQSVSSNSLAPVLILYLIYSTIRRQSKTLLHKLK